MSMKPVRGIVLAADRDLVAVVRERQEAFVVGAGEFYRLPPVMDEERPSASEAASP